MAQRPTISTHVLDTATGRPACGVPVSLTVIRDGVESAAGGGVTDDDGRIADLLAGVGAARPLQEAVYRIRFEVAAYRRTQGDADPFFRCVELEIAVRDTARAYHVPLLLAPFGCTTYRGS